MLGVLFRLLPALGAVLLFSASAPAASAPKGAASPRSTTTDLSALRLNRNILTVRLNQGFYEIMELFDFENRGKATIVSDRNRPTLRLSLPRSSNVRNPDVSEWAVGHGLDRKVAQRIGNEIVTTEPIPPGRKMVVVMYRLADEFGGIVVEKPVLYGTDSFAILAEKGKVQLVAGALNRLEPVTFQKKEFERYFGSLRAGRTFRFRIQAPESSASPVFFLAVGGGIAVLGGGLGFWLRARRKRGAEREALLVEIAALDDRLARGEISSDEHSARRAPRFARLREISR